eukprot:gnl/MRDRNA2_/MRDRNA2_74612_c0_seq1.p1 gnl/MRDRNA2_/MRDRNA2_74612_c0~~gnl/MRDRNA2_/MRDRNA2_74612_c0_seq1.p1  ORF type:complete len:551 (+),score=87.65 gnl/MRDRNA2_/MRDRNA2_74612_c0_seq1:110-1762(+)
MKRNQVWFSLWSSLAYLALPAHAAQKPHIVMVVVDDWGWNDAGHHRPAGDPEIVTPNIVELVKDGIELDRHYVYHYCSPTRCSLQSGRLPVHVGWVNTPPMSVNPNDTISGFSGIPREMTGIAHKMKEGGYRTHATGKWDAGMATWDHTPMGRGYETWFGYYTHANDYWTQKVGASNGEDECKDTVDLWNTTGPAKGRNGTDYEEKMFTENTLNILNHHDPAEPLFLFHAFHQVHTPLEIPQDWEDKFRFLNDTNRRKYAAMVAYMDDALGQIVAKLKSKGMWENTLMVVTSDNGGPTYWLGGIYGGADNNPLKGGKMSDWEGGIRVNAFVTGGAVPTAKRGSKIEDLIHVADWYATFCAIAGVDPTDHRAAKANLPPVDAIDHSDLLLGAAPGGAGNRTEIHHSVRALARGKWKLVTGGYMDGGLISVLINKVENPMGFGIIGWSDYGRGWGKEAIKSTFFALKNCAHGCLYDVFEDPEERHDVSKENPEVHSQLMARLKELNKGVFLPDVGKPNTTACKKWDGFYGPFIDVPVSHFMPPVEKDENVFV